MADKPKESDRGSLPDFLDICVKKGIVDEHAAKRIELHRRSRGHGKYESGSSLLHDTPDPMLTFDSYVVCRGNSFAVELARTVAERPPARLPYNPLYLYGDVGLGKTHLLSAIANAAWDRQVLLVNTADLEAELERASRTKQRAELREWLISAEILLVDDIQLCEDREDLQRDLFSVLNQMTRAQRWVVISSDVPPTRLKGMETRLLSRLGGGVIVSLQMGDKSERRDLIRRLLEDRPMPEDVVDYLAENITDNVRRMKAAISQLLALHDGTHEPLTLDMAQVVAPSPGSLQQRPAKPHDQELAPKPETRKPPPADKAARARRFKEMLAGAESREEQALALQIALGERIRELRNEQGDPSAIRQLEQALDLLRGGKMEEAIRCIST